MSWRESLVRLSSYEVETLQKRLAEVAGRKADVEMRLTMLEAQVVAEVEHARRDPEAGVGLGAFIAGVRRRRARFAEDIAQISIEESGARDGLAQAFEALKKYEQVAQWAKIAEAKEAGRREAAVLDELGLRARAS
jgi:flagellar FliJ protein